MSPTLGEEGTHANVAAGGSHAHVALAKLTAALDEAPTGKFHRRAVVVSGMGFFTDAYDLFVISTVAALVTVQWHLSTIETSWVTGSAILGAFVGAGVFGRIADLAGRRRVYAIVAAVMIVGAVASSLAPDFLFLVVARFVLGLGIGGDYPVSAVLMSEYSNRKDRGRLVGLVFSMQALGLIVGPLVALALLGSGVADQVVWRLLLGLGAVPAAAVIYLRTKMPESPRFVARVQGEVGSAARNVAAMTGDDSIGETLASTPPERSGLRAFLTDRRMLVLLLGTAGSWFLFDYAYYGNTLSLPVILSKVDSTASLMTKLALTLAMFIIFAVPGYLVAIWKMDSVGHRRLQVGGFVVMAACFLVLAAVPVLTTAVVPFIGIFGLSYFFTEYGPNTTTFVMPAEVFPAKVRTTGHGFAAGLGKLGAFVGVFLVPQLEDHIGLRGMLWVATAAALLGALVSRVLPEPAGRGLEEVSGETGEPELRAAAS